MIDVEEDTAGDTSRTTDDPSSPKDDAVAEPRAVPRTPPRNSGIPDPAVGQSPALNSAPHTPLEKIHTFLERKKQDGTPLNDIEYAGLTAMLEKARERT